MRLCCLSGIHDLYIQTGYNIREIRPGWQPDDTKMISLLELIILVLAVQWLLSFFGQSTIPHILHSAGFIDILSVVIILLIIVQFLS